VFPKSERFSNLLFLQKMIFFVFSLDRNNIGCPPRVVKIEKSILSKVRILNFYYKDAFKAAEVLSELHSIGQPIGIEDVMIGSIALSNGLVLMSANTKHFSCIPDLKSENWLL
jgi:tRNA(fMet)-specific endonuclease VapC